MTYFHSIHAATTGTCGVYPPPGEMRISCTAYCSKRCAYYPGPLDLSKLVLRGRAGVRAG
jgi:hypothetical protein